MSRREEWTDKDAKHDQRDASLLLDGSRRDSLAKITPDSVESFSFLYEEYDRANDMEQELLTKGYKGQIDGPSEAPIVGKRIADNCIGWLDNILVLSPAGHGVRARQIVEALKAAHGDDKDIDADMDTSGRGLKHRG